MRTTRLLIGAALLAAAGASPSRGAAQEVPYAFTQKAEIERGLQPRVVGPTAAVETRVTKGAPYSADAVSEFVQVLSDGNRINRKTATRVFRDTEGRTRREQASAGGEQANITINDPVAAVSFVLDPQTRTAVKNSHGFVAVARGGMRGTIVPAPVPPVPLGPEERTAREGQYSVTMTGRGGGRGGSVEQFEGNVKRESLGQRTIEGVLADGTRTTTTIPAGAVGNEQPIVIVSEQWHSPELQVLVLTKHSDPRSGESTYRLSNIVRAEQDRSLFEVPADYTVKEPEVRIYKRQ